MVRDALADYLVRLKNARMARKETVVLPYTSLLWEVSQILERHGYFTKTDRRGKRTHRSIEASLSYEESGRNVFHNVRLVSKRSRRVYKKASELFPFRRGYGMQIISTSKGLLTDIEARKARVGGEVLFEIW